MTKRLVFLTVFIAFCGGISAFGQAPTPTPDASTVTISREAAIKCLEKDDIIKAKDKESAAKDTAINDLKAIISDLKVELAKASTRVTDLEKDQVADRAMIQFFVQNFKIRHKIGLINF